MGTRAARGVVAFALLASLAGLASAGLSPSLAAGRAPTVTTTVSRTIASPGTYLVTVTVRARRHRELVRVSVSGLRPRMVHARPGRPVRLRYIIEITRKMLDVRATVSRSPAVGVSMKLTRELRPSSAAPPSAPTGPTAPATPATPAPPSTSTSATATGATGTTATTATGTGGGGGASSSVDPYQGQPMYFDDEFNSPTVAPPDPTKWNVTGNSGCGGQQLSSANPANVYQDGQGHLVVQASSASSAVQLDSAGHADYTYGTVEASIKLPSAADGLCSALWMVGSSGSNCWPNCGEIDILEALGELPTTATFTLHGPTNDGSANYQQYGAANWNFPDLTAGFHTYGMTWTPTSISWAVDGVTYFSQSRAQLEAANGPGSWVYDAPFHIILDIAVGNWVQGPDAKTQFPAKMLIDWVRWYK